MNQELLNKHLNTYIDDIENSIDKIFVYLSEISEYEFSKDSMAFDAINMRLQVIGESVSNLFNKNPSIFNNTNIPVSEIKGLRNLISHQYYEIDEDEILNICNNDLPNLLSALKVMRTNLESQQKNNLSNEHEMLDCNDNGNSR